MKKKAALWVVVILANLVIGVISVRTYQKLEARVAGVENHQKNYEETYLKNYNDKFNELNSNHRKIATELSRALGVDGKYDFNNNLTRVRDLNKFFDYRTYARINLTLEIPEELRETDSESPKDIKKVNEASAIIISHYVLMASHVSDAEVLSRQIIKIRAPFGIIEQMINFKVLEYDVVLLAADGLKLSLKELYRNKEKDFSLFEISGNAKALNFPFEIGKSNQLQIGHFLYINGRPGIHSEVARPGYVTSLINAVPDEASGGMEVEKDISEFGISQSTDLGDSGSPIIALRDGKPELVGIYLGWTQRADGDNSRNIRSRALKINVAVDEIKEKLGIDLRKLQHQILIDS